MNAIDPEGLINVPDGSWVKMVELLLDEAWHKHCDILPDYLVKYPGNGGTKSTVQVRFNSGTDYPAFLRHSCGPKQGFFWDFYGDDFQSVELAVLALSQAPAPRDVSPMTFTRIV